MSEVYRIYRCKGLRRFDGKIIKMSMAEALKELNNRWLKTAKDIFSCRNIAFEAEEKTVEEIEKLIVEGMFIYSISNSVSQRDIIFYSSRFDVVFMKPVEYRKLVKARS